MSLYLLDTNAVSELMGSPDGAVAIRAALIGPEAICSSIIVAAELRYGAAKRGSPRLAQRVQEILSIVTVVGFDAPTDAIYGDLRAGLEAAGTVIGDRDTLIAAHALALGCILVTDNEREFRRVPGLQVENWLRPTAP